MAGQQLFFIVGAQKAGTTSLYKYLSGHPEIHMPLEKEVPIFDREDIDPAAWEKYRARYLAPRHGEKIVGTATPQYMCDYRIPARIAEYAPNAKIVMLLRDPVERAVSHYKMLAGRGEERRSFDEAIAEQLLPENLERERERKYGEVLRAGEHTAYVSRGEYKRMADLYRAHFSGAVMLVCTEALRDRRKETVQEVLRFLGADADILPRTLAGVYHASDAGLALRIKRWVAESRLADRLARALMPKSARKRFWKKHLSYVGGYAGPVRVSAETYRRLASHYQEASAGLETCMDGWFKRQAAEDGGYIF